MLGSVAMRPESPSLCVVYDQLFVASGAELIQPWSGRFWVMRAASAGERAGLYVDRRRVTGIPRRTPSKWLRSSSTTTSLSRHQRPWSPG